MKKTEFLNKLREELEQVRKVRGVQRRGGHSGGI